MTVVRVAGESAHAQHQVKWVKNNALDEFDGSNAEVLESAIWHDLGTFRPLLLADEAELVHTATLNGHQLQSEILYAGGHDLWLASLSNPD